MNLALKYRPKTFSDITGQKHIVAVLKRMVSEGKTPPALLFAGSRGTGKTTSGRILAAALNCESRSTEDPCGLCSSCKEVFNSTSVDVVEVDAASTGLVEDIRKIRDMVLYSTGGLHRIILLDEAHSMSRAGFNALLKTLEEPPPQTTFVLLTTETQKIPDTVISRCMSFEFRRLSTEDIVSRLTMIRDEEPIKCDDGLIQTIAERVEGGMRDAVMLLDQCRHAEVATSEEFNELFGIHDVSHELLLAAASNDTAKGLRLVEEHFYRSGDASQLVHDLTQAIRDAMVLQEGAEDILPENRRHNAQIISEIIPKDKMVQIIKVLWDLRTKTRHTDYDQRSSMEMAVVIITSSIAGNTSLKPKASTEKMSLDALKELANGRPARS